ncbi:MAG TPA: hypothetical protein VFM34_05485 [Moraxellaceae bacterium]|nr:hypothetical protein [Moraxellaceae bacterium]
MAAITAKKLEKAIEKALVEWLSPLGFRAEQGGCSRWENDIYVYMGCVVTRIGGINRVKPVGQMGFRSSQAIYQAFMHDRDIPSPDRSVDLQADYAHFARSWSSDMRCQSEEDLLAFLESLRIFVMEKLYPTLAAFSEPGAVVDLYLGYDEKDRHSLELPGWHGHGSALKALILARLYRPDAYEILKKRYQPIFEQLLPELRERVTRLLAYLDQQVLSPVAESLAK